RGRAGSDLDAADPIDVVARQGGDVRTGHATRAGRATRRTRAPVRLPRLPGELVRLRGDRARHGRKGAVGMPAGRGSNSLKDPELYEELREDGASKEKAARISNAAAARGRSAVGRTGGKSGAYDDWTVP